MIDIVGLKQFSFIYTLLSIMLCQSFISIKHLVVICVLLCFSHCVFFITIWSSRLMRIFSPR